MPTLEQKIQSILESKSQKAELAEKATLPIGNSDNGDKTPPKAGSSEDAPSQEIDMENNPGASAAAPVKQVAPLTTVGDATSVKTQAQEAVDLKADIAAIFEGQEGLAEEFVSKATSIFEAAVVARVNAEVIKAVEKLTEEHEASVATEKASLSEQVSQYLGYVVENWMKENQVAIDAGLRTEVAEGFIAGLKDLFVENYIEVPEDKVNVLESLTTDLDQTKSRLNEEIEKSIALKDKIVELEKSAVLESLSKDMVTTDAERLTELVEGVEFESKEGFAEKVAIIKEAHFKKTAKKSAETILQEQTGEGSSEKVVHESVKRYVDALTRGSKF